MKARFFWRDLVRPIESAADRRQVETLRYRVYVEEMGKPYMKADHSEKRLADPIDDSSLILGAFDGSTLVGTVRSTLGGSYLHDVTGSSQLAVPAWLDIVPEQHILVCSRLVIDRQARRSGHWSIALMCAMYFHGRERGIRVGLCSTIPPLLGFFGRFGFRPYGAPFEDPSSARTQQPLALLLEDTRHLHSVASPFTVEAEARMNNAPDPKWLAPFDLARPAQRSTDIQLGA